MRSSRRILLLPRVGDAATTTTTTARRILRPEQKPSPLATARAALSTAPRPRPLIRSRSRSSASAANRGPPEALDADAAALRVGNPPTYIGTTKRLPEFNLVDKVVLVSGAARGLGLVQAEALLEAGAIVYALDRLESPSPDFLRIQKRAADELGTTLAYRRIDVRDVAELNAVVEEIATGHGRLDGLIAAAGIQHETSALEYTAKDCDAMMSVNVTGCFMTAQAAARQMIRFGNGGSIVMIASMSGSVANRVAVIQLARNLASEWGGHGIRVNTISPGYIVTAMVEALFETFPERKEEWPRQNMLGRLSRPEEYRGVAAFLISDASSFMTGSDLRMDGGHAAW
ncbi:short chain dehydrogenase [Drepanopeziza brunnea f. sp. 'multigermtubi' MB_m1]|uniref:Short chain dehydrogenase n=1 Tax=Marssonina brunnea f. sp. multigermtubi (strain MB_m1) TaxID=1072389 RepID=K1XMC5_MARBU|nr:short chain dehydrogenase [Drepanopeziza brunnea f. sp. 'multigermtubi' MB_m1]EKD13619.1 short chain dehydrogenase [Drepanopeziza brunnea f. sp. 'multigermtubi' MB_m1]